MCQQLEEKEEEEEISARFQSIPDFGDSRID